MKNKSFEGLQNITIKTSYKKNGRACCMDPVRQKLVYATREEIVRQKVLKYIMSNLSVPKDMISVEEPLSHYGVKTKDRADIIVHSLDETHNELDPLVIIECKAPEVILSSTDIDQVQGYADRLSADYCVLVKDSRTIVLQIYLHPVILFTGGFIKI